MTMGSMNASKWTTFGVLFSLPSSVSRRGGFLADDCRRTDAQALGTLGTLGTKPLAHIVQW